MNKQPGPRTPFCNLPAVRQVVIGLSAGWVPFEMNRLADVFDFVTAEDDVLGLVSDVFDAAHALVHVETHGDEVERLFADAQVPGERLPSGFRTYVLHELPLAGVEERLGRPPARFNLPQQLPPDVLVHRPYRHSFGQMALEEGVVGVVVLCLHAGVGVGVL